MILMFHVVLCKFNACACRRAATTKNKAGEQTIIRGNPLSNCRQLYVGPSILPVDVPLIADRHSTPRSTLYAEVQSMHIGLLIAVNWWRLVPTAAVLKPGLPENAKGVDGRDALTGSGRDSNLGLSFLGCATAAGGLPLPQVRP